MALLAKTIMVSGFEVQAIEKSLASPAHVRLHKMGAADTSFMTPDEAFKLSDAIAAGATIAEGKTDSVWALREIPTQIRDLLVRLRNAHEEWSSVASADPGAKHPITAMEAAATIRGWIDDVLAFDAEKP